MAEKPVCKRATREQREQYGSPWKGCSCNDKLDKRIQGDSHGVDGQSLSAKGRCNERLAGRRRQAFCGMLGVRGRRRCEFQDAGEAGIVPGGRLGAFGGFEIGAVWASHQRMTHAFSGRPLALLAASETLRPWPPRLSNPDSHQSCNLGAWS